MVDVGHKKFSKSLCEENDGIAKHTAVEFLESTGKYVLEVPLDAQKEQFKKRDFLIKNIKNKKDIACEAERKKVWKKEGEWEGWDTIDIPHRKNKSEADIFIMTNSACNTIAITKMKTIHESPIKHKDTIYSRNEPFFAVPISSFKFYTRNEEGEWVKVKGEITKK
jgi:hypothetical protein